MFGDWIHNLSLVNNLFDSDFPHLVIDNFLEKEIADKINDNFPKNLDDFFFYNNPLEVKYSNNKIEKMDTNIKNLFSQLQSKNFVDQLKDLTNIKNLENDPYLHGAGIHLYPRNGRLNLHLDYEKHPISNKQRRLNLILFLNKNWKDEYNGNLELWNKNHTKKIHSYSPSIFNRAIIFKTNDYSWHGLPDKIKCPENMYRQSIAYYWVSEFEYTKKNCRTKASFVKRPDDKYDERIEKLYKIRPNRRIEKEDMLLIFPEWNAEL